MCMQCMAGAMTAGAGASGARSYLAAKGGAWMTPRRLKGVTIALIVGALALSSVAVSGSTPAPAKAAAHAHAR